MVNKVNIYLATTSVLLLSVIYAQTFGVTDTAKSDDFGEVNGNKKCLECLYEGRFDNKYYCQLNQ